MRCAKCSSDNPAAKKFCGDCGATLSADPQAATEGERSAVSNAPPLGDTASLRKIYELGNAFAERLDLDDLIPFVLAKCRELLMQKV